MITNRISQEQFQTLLLGIPRKEIPRLDKKLWSFDWKKEAKLAHRVVHKLTTNENPDVIQGLISWSDFGDHIFVNLVESAPFNRGGERSSIKAVFMKPKNPKLIEEVDVEVVNRQPTAEERREISAFIRSYKTKSQRLAAGLSRPAKV